MSQPRPLFILRWTARLWGIASALLLCAFAFGGQEHLRFTAVEALGFLFFPVGIVVGFVVAWRRELLGGLITVVSLMVFGVYLFVRSGQVLGPWFFLFAGPGVLHIACALLAGRRGGSPMHLRSHGGHP